MKITLATKTLEFHSLNVKQSLSNVLITGKSNFDKKKWATGQSCIRKEITSYRIGSLEGQSISINFGKNQ